MAHTCRIFEIVESQTFQKWISALKDRDGRARIIDRIKRLANGNFGDARSVGGGVEELRMHFGPGYRVYFLRNDNTIIVLLSAAIRAPRRGISSEPKSWRKIGAKRYGESTQGAVPAV